CGPQLVGSCSHWWCVGFARWLEIFAMIRRAFPSQRQRLLVAPQGLSQGCLLLALSASLDRRSEDVRIHAVIIAELEFGNIQRHVFGAHLMERADHAAFEDRPEAFDGLSMHRADDVLAFGMVNARVGIFFVKALIARPLVSAEQ